MPRKEKKPATSVTVVNTIDEAVAGSCPSRVRTMGTQAPARPARTMEITMEIPITIARPTE